MREMLASAGDDGNVLLWVPSETHNHTPSFGEDNLEDKETWRVKHMCRSFGSEIYDLAWSPDGVFFITGSMDNIARIYNAQTGQTVRQIAEHNHYVQGVAWDPLNEFVATQSSDRSVHIYTLKTKDGQFTLAQHGKISKMDLPSRRTSSNSPAPPDLRPQFVNDTSALASPIPSTPGTPTSLSLPMNPPVIAHSRRSSFSSSPSLRRSTSPAPSLPLPAVKPMELSPKVHTGLGVRNANLYANETLISFFRRLTFTPDGSLLFTPAGQYKTSQPSQDGAKSADDVINTVYIYTRAGFNKPPIAHLPGHKKPSIAVRCSPILYTHRRTCNPTKHITVDTSSAEDTMPSLPEPVVPSRAPATNSEMEPPPISSAFPQSTNDSSVPMPSPKAQDVENGSGPPQAFALPYRIVYAVATQDAVLIYDTQQQKPICVVSNLHYATFTDLTWSSDGSTLIMSSSDGFCSAVAFAPGELGQAYTGQISNAHHPTVSSTAASSTQSTPTPTPTSATAPVLNKIPPTPTTGTSAPPVRPLSPTRTSSASSIATQLSLGLQPQASGIITSNPTPTLGSVPSVAATNSGAVIGIPMTTPPQTPLSGNSFSAASSVSGVSVLGKRDTTASESEKEDKLEQAPVKKRRVAPTLVSGNAQAGSAS
ncbi:hypothetical protein FGG08_005405 [Glutinoglossum americanum]|uniref:CAF1B/HIR1 beta-propeller domain-containing protein n=1 Tax=Glutinoglossum americanum TaxID=1670608 RepID=A0A9P8I5I2_9PEZI|nr:hypothetical protein FGG08_005405 [Glutinoglossum americanum]